MNARATPMLSWAMSGLFCTALLAGCATEAELTVAATLSDFPGPPRSAPAVSAEMRAQCLRPASQRGVVQNEMSAHWQMRVRTFLREPPRADPDAIVFVGDSITERANYAGIWPALADRIVDRGIGGDKVGGGPYLGVLDRLGDIAGARPRTIILMIGVNDILFAKTPSEQLEACYAVLVAQLAGLLSEPRHLVLTTTLPAERGSENNRQIRRFNGVVRALAEAHGYSFADTAAHLAMHRAASHRPASSTVASPFLADGLHLSPSGYRVIAACAIGPALVRLGYVEAKATLLHRCH